MLEKNSIIPIYLQLKSILKTSIMNGEFGENEMIPSETQLAETYHITRTTVRRSISELVNENLLRKEHGRGTFVCLNPIHYSIWNFTGFTDYAQKKGKIPTSKILTAEVISIHDKSYYKLERARGIKEDAEILYVTVDTSCIPLDLFPGIMAYDFEKRSLYDVMRKEYGIAPSIVELSIKPHIVDHRIACVFGVPDNVALLMVKGTVSSEDNLQVELTQVIYSPHIDFNLATRINT
ncbi:MAG: GntR family transcriptional regulator [Anaerolineaceae bacterium]|nr:GntR family transcriptional regulator [Anaerolineaceae bacterium]